MFSKILVCLDGSKHCERAADKALAIAKESQSCVIILHVGQSDSHDSHASTPTEFTVAWQLRSESPLTSLEMLDDSHRAIETINSQFQRAGMRPEMFFETGHAAAQIVRVAEREGADLIVMGSRGLNPLESLLLGSVSMHVIQHAPCSVLIVR